MSNAYKTHDAHSTHEAHEAQLQRGLAALALAAQLPVAARAQLLAYLDLLYKWNKTYRLTALQEDAQAVSHHLLDSLSLLPYLKGDTLLDVGSGGGTPGIPLAIACPSLAVTLLDSNSKKTAFLQQAVIELGLKNVRVVCARCEDFRDAAGFMQITARAFAELADFTRLTAHLLRPTGEWLAMKGIYPQAEIAALSAAIQVKSVFSLTVPELTGERHLVVLQTCNESA